MIFARPKALGSSKQCRNSFKDVRVGLCWKKWRKVQSWKNYWIS